MAPTRVWIDSLLSDKPRLLAWKNGCFYSAEVTETDQAAWEERLRDARDPAQVIGPGCQVAPIQLVTRVEVDLGGEARIYYGKNGMQTIKIQLVLDGQQLLDGARSTMFLPESQQSAGGDDGKNDQCIDRVAQVERQPGGTQQQQDDRALELTQQQRERIRALSRLEAIAAMADEPLPRVFGGQAAHSRSEALQQLGRADAPESRGTRVHGSAPARPAYV